MPEVMAEIERLPAPSRSYLVRPDRKRQFVENLVMNELLYREGQETGLDRDAEIERQVKDLRKRLIVQRVMRKYQAPPTIDDQQVRAYYDEYPQLYSTTQVRASHILVADETAAQEVREALEEDPERFESLAEERSTDRVSAKKGGDLGTFTPGRMVADFDRVAFSQEPGTISDPVRTRYGYHIIKVVERTAGTPRPFQEVKERIRSTLRNEQVQKQVADHFAELKEKAKLTIDEDVLASIEPPRATAPDAVRAHP